MAAPPSPSARPLAHSGVRGFSLHPQPALVAAALEKRGARAGAGPGAVLGGQLPGALVFLEGAPAAQATHAASRTPFAASAPGATDVDGHPVSRRDKEIRMTPNRRFFPDENKRSLHVRSRNANRSPNVGYVVMSYNVMHSFKPSSPLQDVLNPHCLPPSYTLSSVPWGSFRRRAPPSSNRPADVSGESPEPRSPMRRGPFLFHARPHFVTFRK